MSSGAVYAAWYRFVVTWRCQRGGYLTLVLLIGLVGGIALGSIAAARRTVSSFSTFLAGTNPSDLTIVPAGGLFGYSPRLAGKIGRLAHVETVESYVALSASLIGPGGTEPRSLDSSVIMVGSVDGLLFNQDRFSVTAGRMADPARPDEVMVTQNAAAALGLHLGQNLSVGLTPTSGSGPERRLRLRIVGIGLLNREVVQDQIARFPTYIVATPALTRSVLGDVAISYYGVEVQGGARFVPAVEREFTATEHYFTDFLVASQLEAEAAQSIKPEALALGVFGGIAGLAALLLAIQAIARQLSARDEDLLVLRAIGADPATTGLDSLIGLAGSVVAGSLLAVAVAVALSPLAPIGPVRPVYPDPGVSADWLVLGVGFAVLVGVLTTSAGLISYLEAPHRAERRRGATERRSATVQLLAKSQLPVSAVAGAQFALERGRGRTAAATTPWALLGGVIAMTVVAATLTFGSSLQALVSQPRLFGWNWDYAVQSSDGYGPVPDRATATLASDRTVIASSGVWFATLQLDGVEVPLLLANLGAPVSPPIIQGHGLTASNQVVLGAATLAQLHKRIGDTVEMSYTSNRRGHDARHRDRRGAADLDGNRCHRACRQRDPDEEIRPGGLSGLQRAEHGLPAGSRRSRVPRRVRRGTKARQRRERHLDEGTPELELRGQPGVGAIGATSGADRELPHHGDHAGPAGFRARPGCGGRPGSRAHRVCAPAPARPRHAEDPRVHATTTGGGSRLAGVHRRGGDRGRHPSRHRSRALAVDSVRTGDRRRVRAERARVVGGRRRSGRARPRQRRRRLPGPERGTHADRARAPRRVALGPPPRPQRVR